jgi:hypothetical protein
LCLDTPEALRVPIGGQVLLYRWCCLLQDPPASEQALVLLGVAGGQVIAFQPQIGAFVLVIVRSQVSSSPTVRLLCELTVRWTGYRELCGSGSVFKKQNVSEVHVLWWVMYHERRKSYELDFMISLQ